MKLGKHRHHKGDVYILTGCAHHTETGETLVLYRKDVLLGHDFPMLHARPFDIFYAHVTVDGKSVPRFEFIGGDDE